LTLLSLNDHLYDNRNVLTEDYIRLITVVTEVHMASHGLSIIAAMSYVDIAARLRSEKNWASFKNSRGDSRLGCPAERSEPPRPSDSARRQGSRGRMVGASFLS